MQAVENPENAFLQGGSADDAVIDDDQVVLPCPEAAIGDVIDMGGKFLLGVAFGYEGPELDVLDGDLLASDDMWSTCEISSFVSLWSCIIV